jgi:hypothetical protein
MQCSQTLTRCSKQNWLVTFRLGHLHKPMILFWKHNVIILCEGGGGYFVQLLIRVTEHNTKFSFDCIQGEENQWAWL